MLRVLVPTLFLLAMPSTVLFSCGSTGDQTSGSGGASPGGAGSSSGSGGTAGSHASAGGATAGTTSGGSSSAGAQTGGASSSGAGGTGGGGDSAGTAGTGGAGPTPCGAETCSASQYCVNPCCGGAPPQCIPQSSGGTCPPGTHLGCTVNPQGCSDPANCCQQDPCTPPPPFCSDQIPIGCYLIAGHSCRMTCA